MTRERFIDHPLVKTAIGFAGMAALVELSFGAFSRSQRRWIIERDGDRCQAPFPHNCDQNDHPKQVHHIKPQGYLKEVAPEVCPDYPENGITLCRNAHEAIHPDVPTARHEYHQDHGSFGKLREQRNQKLRHRQIYWVDKWDRVMEVIALRNTRRHEKLFKYPENDK